MSFCDVGNNVQHLVPLLQQMRAPYYYNAAGDWRPPLQLACTLPEDSDVFSECLSLCNCNSDHNYVLIADHAPHENER
jgi:hypothetical protein